MTPREPDHRPQRRAVDPKTGRLYRIVRAFKAPPQAVRKARLDNVALVPASLLPYKAQYQAIANRQVPGTTLLVLPEGDSLPRQTLERVATRMRTKGQLVRTMLGSKFREGPR